MENSVLCILGVIFVFLVAGCSMDRAVSEREIQADSAGGEKLGVLWTSSDPDVAHKVCFMYTYNAKKQGWFDEVELIVWGPSARLLAGDDLLQAYVKKMINAGVRVKACKACADSYGVSEKLASLGIEVKYMGKPLTEMIKGDWEVLVF